MEALDPKRLAANAYRVLGLPADAGQAAIDGAARRMRIWADSNQVPATPWDLPALGPLSRTRHEIDRAASRLIDPPLRIQERLFWFNDPELCAQGAAAFDPVSLDPATLGRQTNLQAHDAALRRLAAAMSTDPHFDDTVLWERVLRWWSTVVRSQAYQAWFLAAEERGDFEKRVTPDEVASALTELPESIAAALAERACEALDRNQAADCQRILPLLRAAAPDPDVAHELQTRIANVVEDLLAARCDALCNEIYRGVNWDPRWTNFASVNAAACFIAQRKITESVDPLLALLTTLDGPDRERLRRIGGRAGRMFRNLGLGWSRSGERKKAKEALLRATTCQPGAPMLLQLKTDLKSVNRTATQRGKLGWVALVAVVVSTTVSSLSHQPPAPSVEAPRVVPQFLNPDHLPLTPKQQDDALRKAWENLPPPKTDAERALRNAYRDAMNSHPAAPTGHTPAPATQPAPVSAPHP